MNRYRNSLGTIAMIAAIVFGTTGLVSAQRTVAISGTYDLDRDVSDRVDDVVADVNVADNQRQDLVDKLDAPDQIAIDLRGTQVTLATSKASPVTFTADGRDKTETDSNGRTIRLRATLSGDRLILSSIGGDTDYTITFTSSDNGQVLKVSRRITTDYLNQTVFAESTYNKTDSVARLGIPTNGGGNNTTTDTNSGNGSNSGSSTTDDPNGGYSDNDQNGNVSNGGTNSSSNGNPNGGYNPNRPSAVYVKPGNYVVADGTMMTGVLDNEINTKVSQNNDRFRMKIQSPDEYRGAIVEGYVSGINRSGKVTGASTINLNFDKITMNNGQSYDFAATLRGVTDATGKIVKVDNEGTIKGDSQSNNTAIRGGIGAGIGAIIGAIAGGGKWAGIGAIIGGGAGAGSVAIQDRKDVQITKGSTVSIQAAAPAR